MMTQKNDFTNSGTGATLASRMLIGAAVAFMLMVLFLYGVDEPNPEWGKYWMVRPLLVISAAGAVGGAFFYFIEKQRFEGWPKLGAILLSMIVYIIGLWMGSVLGLVGTLWN